MCEFCVTHGEGKKWYLQMKNYSDELLHHKLSSSEREVVKVSTRAEWLANYFEQEVAPAATGVTRAAAEPAKPAEAQPSVDEYVTARKVEQFGQVVPLEDLQQVVDIADSITRMACACRFVTTGRKDQRYCFGLGVDKWGVLGKFPDAASSLEVLDKDQAKDALGEYDEEGLIHTVWTGVTPYICIACNCDRDCRPYKRYLGGSGTHAFFRGEYISRVDWDLCTGCKACLKQCQFGAQFYSSTLSKVHIDPLRCFGCGVCRAVCPHDAIALVPREEHPEAAELWLR